MARNIIQRTATVGALALGALAVAALSIVGATGVIGARSKGETGQGERKIPAGG
jgi:hypothetical protein